jgi:hypothetical protein
MFDTIKRKLYVATFTGAFAKNNNGANIEEVFGAAGRLPELYRCIGLVWRSLDANVFAMFCTAAIKHDKPLEQIIMEQVAKQKLVDRI